MGKRIKKLVGCLVAVAAVGCGAAPEDTGNPEERAETENVGTSSEALPKCDEDGLCGGTYEPPEYYPYDYECGTGETRWNSGNGCSPSRLCRAGITGCGLVNSVRRCGSSGCGPAPSPTTNPCYGGYAGQACTLSGGYLGHCNYDWSYQLACFP